MRDYDSINNNLQQARERLKQARNNVERMKALNDIHKYEWMLANMP